MINENKIEKLRKNYSIIDWILISINQNKFISNAIIVGFILWGINLVFDTYNPPATQRQIDKIVESNIIRDRRDSAEVFSKAIKMEELNHKMDIQDLKLQYVITSQNETKEIALAMQSQLLFLNKNIKQFSLNHNRDSIYTSLFVSKNN